LAALEKHSVSGIGRGELPQNIDLMLSRPTLKVYVVLQANRPNRRTVRDQVDEPSGQLLVLFARQFHPPDPPTAPVSLASRARAWLVSHTGRLTCRDVKPEQW
jgi:hypothetical protein